MYYSVFHKPKFRISDKVNVAVPTFETDCEEKTIEIFLKRYLGQDIITTSAHASRELAYKQIYDMGSVVESHAEFSSPALMCKKCLVNQSTYEAEDGLCHFCRIEATHG